MPKKTNYPNVIFAKSIRPLNGEKEIMFKDISVIIVKNLLQGQKKNLKIEFRLKMFCLII